MEKWFSQILLLIFVGFLFSISTNFSLYVDVLNGGSAVEDATSIPEEQHEEQAGDAKAKDIGTEDFYFHNPGLNRIYSFHHCSFSLVENIYFDVLCPPPERI